MFVDNEKSRIICMKRDLTKNLTFGFVCLKLKFTRNFPLHSSLQSKSKSNNNKMRNSYSYFNYLFLFLNLMQLLLNAVQNYYFFSKLTNIFSLFSAF